MPASLETPMEAAVATADTLARPVKAPATHPRELERLQYLGRMVSAVSHELNNRLTSVVGYADLMYLQNNPSGMQRLAGKLREQTETLRIFAEGIAGFSKSIQGKPLPFNLACAVGQVAELAKCETKFRGIPFFLKQDAPEFCATAWPSEFRLALFACIYELTRWLALQAAGESKNIVVSCRRVPDARAAEVCVRLERRALLADASPWPTLPDLAMALEIFAEQNIRSKWQSDSHSSLSLSLVIPEATRRESEMEGVGV
ncbi:MAG: HAMP domain-containing histidine kinase [Planctomycetota bacterium]|nr:HAMP domain-containing histidine kinase [Planctomycetota bacterium]